MQERLQAAMAEAKIPGLAVAVLRDRSIIYTGGFGTTSAEAGASKVTPQTLFRIGSITKTLTGMAILRLVDDGLLDLDMPVTHYLPWLQLSDPAAADQMTPRMLLTHTSGLPTDGGYRSSRDPEGLERFLRTDLQRYPLVAPPGRLYRYSNLGFSLLGHLAEAVTGKAYPDLMQHLVFDPLQMERTTLAPTMAMSYPLSQSHRLAEDGSLQVVRPFADNAAEAPVGFAYSNVPDLAKVALLHLSGGEFAGRRLLSPESLAAMHTACVPTYSAGGGGRGLALFVEPHPRSGLARIYHAGGISGFAALFELYPESGTSVILLLNRASAIGKLRDILLEECLGLPTAGWRPPVIDPPDLQAWPSYTGTYVSDSEGLVQVRVEGNRLLLDWNGKEFPLDCRAAAHYVAPWQNGHLGVGFLTEPDGQVAYVMVAETPFRRVGAPETDVHPDTWERYAGAYRLHQPPMTVRMEGGRLLLHSAFYGEEVHCIPLSDNEFACKWGRFSFVLDPAGEVESMRWGTSHSIPRLR